MDDEVDKLRNAIRKHRDIRGDDRCFRDDADLYRVLPEGDTRPGRETEVTLENCYRYIKCRQGGREYVSPQRRIEELEAEVERLKLESRPTAVMTEKELEDLWKQCEDERMNVLEDTRNEAEKWKAEGDMYGWNFHMGIASGTIEASFIYGRVFKEMKKNADGD